MGGDYENTNYENCKNYLKEVGCQENLNPTLKENQIIKQTPDQMRLQCYADIRQYAATLTSETTTVVTTPQYSPLISCKEPVQMTPSKYWVQRWMF